MEIKDDTYKQFVSKEWIGCGKKYPECDTPPHILTARAAVLAIPDTYAGTYLPHPHLSVLDFLRVPFPAQPSVLVSEQADASCFSALRANEELTCLRTRKIPPSEWIQKLEKAFGQAWFDGAQSIVDRQFGQQSRLPLWVITYWKETSIIIQKRGKWKDGTSWLNAMGQDHKNPCIGEADEARETLSSLAWGATLCGVGRGLTVEVLAVLLSGKWINDDIINMSMRYLAERTHLFPELSRSTIIAPLIFSYNLEHAHTFRGPKTNVSSHLHRYTKLFKEGLRTILYFPAHINNNHWVVFCINFKKRTLQYGDSLSQNGSKPIKMIQATQSWLKGEFGAPFREDQDSLKHGIQEDSFSCGICVVNTIAHNLFGDELFRHSRRYAMRISLFTQLAQSQLDTASESTEFSHHQFRTTQDLIEADDHNMTVVPGSTPVESNEDAETIEPEIVRSNREPETGDGDQLIQDTLSENGYYMEGSEHTSLSPDSPASSLHDLVPDPPIDTDIESECPGPSHAINTLKMKKRRLSVAASTDTNDGLLISDKHVHKKLKQQPATKPSTSLFGPVGISKTAVAEQKLKTAMQDGTLKMNKAKLKNYEDKCRLEDKNVRFRYGTNWEACHSKCGKWYKQKIAYDTSRFATHVKNCKAKGNISTLSGFFVQHTPRSQTQTTTTATNKKVKIPANSQAAQRRCPGITEAIEPLVRSYVRRSGAQGGGSRALHILAKEEYGKTYADLDDDKKEIINIMQRHERTWIIDRELDRVYATNCRKLVGSDDPEDHPYLGFLRDPGVLY
ncbi:hypothetical protein BJ138DRAFT_1112718 [Hygrophoropsis aurantiaca]|uniref:Uncharacterized protein n=1 Tax=Hygrophoropsis aurantiaca TaxID=72124 RepID=A0ACB8AGI2_9AGAM|nr:hypothetical protein BJ138DRAFT_1112718 [Hygrophoropsis aurantiaca]